MSPLRRHTLAELQALTHDDLVDLVLDLESRNAELQAAIAARDGRASASYRKEASTPQKDASTPQKEALQGQAMAEEPEPEDRTRLQRPNLKLERALSKIPTNTAAAAQLRAELAQAVESTALERSASSPGQRLTSSNFFLPDLRDQEPQFAEYIRSKLTAPYHQQELEEAQALNWAVGKDLAEEHKLHVLWTQSDGNCLLHATLLAMWGLHDTQEVGGTGGLSTLRAAMSRLLQEPRVAEPIQRRWAVQIKRDSTWEPQSQEQAAPQAGSQTGRVEISEAQLAREWADMVELAVRPSAFLDSVHVLAMANVLWRPIVILASNMQRDPFGQPLTPIFFRGIYLPFERKAESCCRQPLVLCFQDAHFMPAVPVAAAKGSGPVHVPLADGAGELPLRFAFDEELKRKWELVREYLDIESEVHLPKANVTCNMAVLQRDSSHPAVKEMMAHFVERGEVTYAAELQETRRVELLREANAKRSSTGPSEAESAKKQKLQPKQDDPPEAASPSGLHHSLAKKPPGQGGASGVVPMAAGKPHAISVEEEEVDAQVADRWAVRLPKGVRPGDMSMFHMPKGCTDQDVIQFKVPKGRFAGDVVILTANFKVKGHCIKALREVTQLNRVKALELLAKSHGDADAAARNYFEQLQDSQS